MDADDRMVAGIVAARARRMANLALLMGGGGALLSVVPHVVPVLPVQVYGVCTVVPIVLGLAGPAGAIASLRETAGHPPGVREALCAHGLGSARLVALLAIAIGLVGLLSGVLAGAMMEPADPLF
ncbi:MAG: hypothetical protein ABIO70_08225 [Pseudomonadota bacterium]